DSPEPQSRAARPARQATASTATSAAAAEARGRGIAVGQDTERIAALRFRLDRKGGETRLPFLFFAAGVAFDAGADLDEFFFDALVAAVDVVNAVDPGGVVGNEGREHQARAG